VRCPPHPLPFLGLLPRCGVGAPLPFLLHWLRRPCTPSVPSLAAFWSRCVYLSHVWWRYVITCQHACHSSCTRCGSCCWRWWYAGGGYASPGLGRGIKPDPLADITSRSESSCSFFSPLSSNEVGLTPPTPSVPTSASDILVGGHSADPGAFTFHFGVSSNIPSSMKPDIVRPSPIYPLRPPPAFPLSSIDLCDCCAAAVLFVPAARLEEQEGVEGVTRYETFGAR